MICPSRKHAVESAVADPGSRLMEPAQLAVHGRTGPRVTVLDEGCGLALFAMLGLGSLEHLAEPVRRRSDTAAARRDGVPATARVQARWGDDVPAVAADVDAGTEPAARVVQHGEAGVGEVEVPSSGAGADGTAGLQRTMVPQHRVEAVVAAVIGIDVDDDESTRGAGPDGDVGAWPAAPPPPDHGLVSGRLLEPTPDAWMLGRRAAVGAAAGARTRGLGRAVTREDLPTSAGVDHCGVDRAAAPRRPHQETPGSMRLASTSSLSTTSTCSTARPGSSPT